MTKRNIMKKSHTRSAQEDFWTYHAASETPSEPPSDSPMTRDQWESFSPGMRREIWRDHNRRAAKIETAKAGI